MPDDLESSAEPEAADSFGSEPAEPTVAEKAEAALDDAIEKALGPDEETKVSARSDDPEDDEDELADIEDDAEDDDDELEASDGDEDDEDEGEESDEDDDEDMALHRAYTRLHEKGIPAKVLKRTPKAELIAWANRVGDEPKSTKDVASKAEQTRETPSDAMGSEPATPAEDAWAVARRGYAEKLGIDEDSADVFKTLHETNAALQARLDAIERRDAQREGQVTIDKELRRLGATFPELKRDEEKRDKVVEKAGTAIAGLKARGEQITPQRVREAFNDAARAVAKPQRADLAQKRRNGTSTPPESLGNGRMQTLDEDGFWLKATDLAFAGKADAIKRLSPPPPPKRR